MVKRIEFEISDAILEDVDTDVKKAMIATRLELSRDARRFPHNPSYETQFIEPPALSLRQKKPTTQ